FFVTPDASAHQRAKYNVVIDTDCGMDDFRALTYFMASRDFNIDAVQSVGAVLDAETSSQCLASLLGELHHEGILLGKGLNAKNFKKNCSPAIDFWKNRADVAIKSRADAVYTAIINSRKPVIYVAMGPLTNLADLVDKHPEIVSKLTYVVWTSRTNDKHFPCGYNYNLDKSAFDKVVASGLKLKVLDAGNVLYPDDFLSLLPEIATPYALTFASFYEGQKFSSVRFCDDLLPFYILYPELFEESAGGQNFSVLRPKQDAYFDVIATRVLNAVETEKGVIITEMPRSGSLLSADVAPLAEQILSKYGYTEYKLVLLTSEMHSHLGIYSIIGAKMGLRILEYLHVGLDEVTIVSNAGSEPPISCLNDGLQIGAGTTLGYGAITISADKDVSPSVVVNYNGRKLLFKVKDEVKCEIASDVMELIRKHGLESDVYWSEIRRIAIEKYWKEKSRFEIFEVEEK
ncbi:MAG: nucleoside hydrolase, partial [Bacteroidales bacterium]|nr:nucleoside hydrolase [Bacteroidales bacterium]